MAKRTPITIDLGDGIDRPIWYSAEYVEKIQIEHGDWQKFLSSENEYALVPRLIYEGLKDKGDFTLETVKRNLDASLMAENLNAIIQALTGQKLPYVNNRAPEDPAKNEPIQTVQ